MRISVEEFLKLPKWKLFMFSSSDAFPDEVNGNNDVCMLTHNEISDIQHAVKASDTKIYDAFALQTWLSKQYDMFYVIPGLNITEIEYCSIVEYNLRKSFNLAKFIFSSMHQFLQQKLSHKLRKYTKSYNEKTVHQHSQGYSHYTNSQTSKITNQKKGCLVPSSLSAFTPYQPHS